MSKNNVKMHDLENATTFEEIFDAYIIAIEEAGTRATYEKEVAKDSLYNLANFLDKVTPLSVEQWGEINRMKHEQ
tara:strand:- start:352 stop:576 length:225 start_codon:yes stop_codon:yes gene_type:complete